MKVFINRHGVMITNHKTWVEVSYTFTSKEAEETNEYLESIEGVNIPFKSEEEVLSTFKVESFDEVKGMDVFYLALKLI